MTKINKNLENIKNESDRIRKAMEPKSNDFINLIGNRAKIVGESKTSILFCNKTKEKVYYLWLPKTIVFKNDYSLYVNINIPKNWELTPYDNENNEYSIDLTSKSGLDDLIETMGFVLKNKEK